MISFPREASEAILPGYAVCESSDKVALLDVSGQTTIVTTMPLGISATETSANGDEIGVYGTGEECMAIAGAAVTAPCKLVAQTATGKLIAYSEATYTDGQAVYIVANALEDASGDGIRFRVRVVNELISVSNPA